MPLLATFEELSQGLRQMGGSALIFLPLALIPIGALVAITVLQLRRSRSQASTKAEGAFQQALKKRTLDPAEVSLLKVLAGYVPDELRRPEILSNPRVFQAAVERALRSQSLQEDDVAALRVSLGFSSQDSNRTVNSTAELPVELPLIVEQEKVRRFRAKMEKVEPRGMTILTEDGEIPPAAGSILQIYFKREAGIFTFSSRVISLDGPRARIAHSEKISRYQKREYYRRKLAMPVQVRVAGSEEKPAQHKFLDLGGGGASITNPDLRFRPGDDIEITFKPGTEEPFELVGEVIRLSDAGKVMHVSFGPIREAMRDRIIGYILNIGKEK
jgi:hypothetical protein